MQSMRVSIPVSIKKEKKKKKTENNAFHLQQHTFVMEQLKKICSNNNGLIQTRLHLL